MPQTRTHTSEIMDLQRTTFNLTGSPTLESLTLFWNTKVATSSSCNTSVKVGGSLLVRSYTNQARTTRHTTRHYQPAKTTATSASVERQAQRACVWGSDRERAPELPAAMLNPAPARPYQPVGRVHVRGWKTEKTGRQDSIKERTSHKGQKIKRWRKKEVNTTKRHDWTTGSVK
jgi:hypothetical protein